MTTQEEDFDVDDTLDASFPASDPPAWTTTHAGTPKVERSRTEAGVAPPSDVPT